MLKRLRYRDWSTVLDLSGVAALLIVPTIGLTGLGIHNFANECHETGGTLTHETWHGVPIESTCHYR